LPATVANIIVQHLMPRMKHRDMGECPVTPQDTASLAYLQAEGVFTQRQVKTLIAFRFGEITEAQMYERIRGR
jgi:Asp-tRNA(Asn)/Glu-tRNA(Gln) amidotransferase B subunit